MITLLLTRTGDDDGVYLKLPATQEEIDEAWAELNSLGTDTATTRITEVISNVYNLGRYIKNTNMEEPGSLDKLTELARKLQTMGRDSCLMFEGMLDANSINSIDDVLRLADRLENYILLPDIVTGSALGKHLVNQGVVRFPENVKPYLDYQIIGEEFYADHGGAFCRGGYAVMKSELPGQFLTAFQEDNDNWVISLRLRSPDKKSVELRLPATETVMEQTKQRLGIDEFAEADLYVIDYNLPYLAQLIPCDGISVEDANELALSIEQMQQTDGELLTFLSALSVECPDSFACALHIAFNMDDYERVPEDVGEYGRMVLQRLGASDEILDTIDGYMDFATLGEAYVEEYGVVRTEYGLIRRLSSPFDEQHMGGMEMR